MSRKISAAACLGGVGFVCSAVVLVIIIGVAGSILSSMSAGIDSEKVRVDMEHGNDAAAFAIAFYFILLMLAGLTIYTVVSGVVGLAVGFFSVCAGAGETVSETLSGSAPVIACVSMLALDLKLALLFCGWIMSPAAKTDLLFGLLFIGAVFIWIAAVTLLSSLAGGWLGKIWQSRKRKSAVGQPA